MVTIRPMAHGYDARLAILACWVLAAFLLVPGCASQDVTKPPLGTRIAYKPIMVEGDRWVMSDEAGRKFYEAEVTHVGGLHGGFTMRIDNEANSVWSGTYVLDEDHKILAHHIGIQNKSNFLVGRQRLDFPLYVGKTWTSRFLLSSPNSIIASYKVTGVEEVRTPAGTFATFRIAFSRVDSQEYRKGTGSFWYAPAAKAIVKEASSSGTTIVLSSYSVEDTGQGMAIYDGREEEPAHALVAPSKPVGEEGGSRKEGRDEVPPLITVTQPKAIPGSTIEAVEEQLAIEGVATDPSGIVFVKINGQEATVGADGTFVAHPYLVIGENRFVIEAMDGKGNQGSKVLAVVRAPKAAAQDSAGDRELDGGNYWALVIGIDRYENWPVLSTAVRDAAAVSEVLRSKFGFKPENVTTLVDSSATRRNILDAVIALADKVGEDDSVMVYYAGHGFLDARFDKGYWIPVEAEASLHSVASFISNADMKDYLAALPAKHVFLVSDSCFSGDFLRSAAFPLRMFQDPFGFYRKKHALESRIVIAAGGVEPVADGGREGHSVFAYYFLKALRDTQAPYLTPSDIYTAVREALKYNAAQQPQIGYLHEAGHNGGEIVLQNKLWEKASK